MTEGCQSWLDEKVFRGVFTAEEDQDQNQNQNLLWDRTGPDNSTWSELDSADVDKGHGFTYGQ